MNSETKFIYFDDKHDKAENFENFIQYCKNAFLPFWNFDEIIKSPSDSKKEKLEDYPSVSL